MSEEKDGLAGSPRSENPLSRNLDVNAIAELRESTEDGLSPFLLSDLLLEVRELPTVTRHSAIQSAKLLVRDESEALKAVGYIEQVTNAEQVSDRGIIDNHRSFGQAEVLAIVRGLSCVLEGEQRRKFIDGLQGRLAETERGHRFLPDFESVGKQAGALIACFENPRETSDEQLL